MEEFLLNKKKQKSQTPGPKWSRLPVKVCSWSNRASFHPGKDVLEVKGDDVINKAGAIGIHQDFPGNTRTNVQLA